MANPTITINSLSVSPATIQAGTKFTLTISAVNNLGVKATSYSVHGSISVPYTNQYGNADYCSFTIYHAWNQPVSWANGSSKTLAFNITANESLWTELSSFKEEYPDADIRCRDINWSLHLEGDDFVYAADDFVKKGQALDWFYAPTIEEFVLERGADGVPNDEGENVISSIKIGVSETAQMDLLSLTLYYSDAGAATTESSSIDLTAHIPDLLNGITGSADLITQTFSSTSPWSFLLVFGDQYESTSAAFTVSRAFANVHLSGASTGGVALGGFSTAIEGEPKFESHYPAHFYEQANFHNGTTGIFDVVYNKQVSKSVSSGTETTIQTYTVPSPGVFLVIVNNTMQPGGSYTTGYRFTALKLNQNGTLNEFAAQTASPQSGAVSRISCVGIVSAKTGEIITMRSSQNSGSSATLSTRMTVIRLGGQFI